MEGFLPPPKYRGVAQFGSALEWGSRGRKFDSCHSDQKKKGILTPFSFVLAKIYFAVSGFPFNKNSRGTPKSCEANFRGEGKSLP